MTQRLIVVALTVLFACPIGARTFTDDKGRRIEAELLGVDGINVTFNKGGQEFTLPITRFSAPDQEFIKSWAAEKAAPSASTPTGPKPTGPKPGANLTFEFPELEKDFSGKPAAFSARIPQNYDPAKPVPLFIFLGGGKGTSSPGGAVTLTNGDFVCVGLPYPNSGRNPRQSNMVGRFDNVWNYWKPMIAKLEEAVPNLDPKIRIIGGFSNGAHAIDGLLGEEKFTSAFSAFVLIEGGGTQGGTYRGARDRHIYYAWGEKSPIAAHARTVLSRAKRGQMKIRYNEMKGVGHQFPAAEKTGVKSWLYETVLPDLRP